MLDKILHDISYWAAFVVAPLFLLVLNLVSPAETSALTYSLFIPLLLLILIYPILEEVVFRGLLQGWLLQWPLGKRRLAGISFPNFLTTLAFVSLHFIQHAPIWAIAVFIPSLIFGFYRERYNSIAPGMVLHCWYNACYFLVYSPS